MNQRELAEQLQVSQTAVSLVLNDPSTLKIAAETRERILDALRETQYRKHHKVLALKKIYFVSNSASIYQKQRFLDGVFQFAEPLGISVELKSVDFLLSRKNRRYDGIGCILHGNCLPEQILEMRSRMPVCHLNPPPEPYLCDSVSGDSRESVRRSILHFLAGGAEPFALWGFPDFQTNESGIYFQHKVEAFRALFPELTGEDAGAHLILVPSATRDYEELVRLACGSLKENPGFQAFLATSYIHARILYDAAIRRQKRCRILSCGYLEYKEDSSPLIDYITCDLVKMGRVAAAQLLKRAECPELPVCALLCCPELIEGGGA